MKVLGTHLNINERLFENPSKQIFDDKVLYISDRNLLQLEF